MLLASANSALLGFTAQYALRPTTGVRALAIMGDAPVVDFSGAPKLQQDGTFEGYNAEGNKIVTDGNQNNYRKLSDKLQEADIERRLELEEIEKRENNHIPTDDPIIFLEVTVVDASNFAGAINVRGEERFGFQILRVYATTVPNSIAALMLRIRDETGVIPHVYFAWTEGNPLVYIFNYIVFGQGDVPPLTHEVLRNAEPNPAKRPRVHVGG